LAKRDEEDTIFRAEVCDLSAHIYLIQGVKCKQDQNPSHF